jgi:nitroreductase
MDTLKAIARVRVVRAYRPDPLPDDVLTRILDTGRHAGSSKNLQRWTFVVVRDRDALRRLAEVGPFGQPLTAATAGIALVTPSDDTRDSVTWDLGRAAQNMVLAAWALGVGSCPVTVYDHDLASRLLGLPDGQRCPFLLAMGWPADPDDLTRPPRAGGRRELAEVVRYERW